MIPYRETTVLFADVTGSTRLYEQAGDKRAADGIHACVKVLHGAAQASGGRVVKDIGDEIMALFPTADRAAEAASRMHVAISALPPVAGQKLAVRIGFHAGPVIQRGDDVFGDTVNLASQLVTYAAKGQVLTSAETVGKLTAALRNSTRQLYDITVEGKAADVPLFELLWSKSADTTDFPLAATRQLAPHLPLRLKLGDRELVCRRLVESITIGRDARSTFVVDEATASRHHCVIERRQQNFIVRDHSANGTFVSFPTGGPELVLRREELVLHGRGWLAFGQPKADATRVLAFFREEEGKADGSLTK